jgi:hypothetical protein
VSKYIYIYIYVEFIGPQLQHYNRSIKTTNTSVAGANINLTHVMVPHISKKNTQETFSPCHVKLPVINHKRYTSKQLTRQVITAHNTLVAQLHVIILSAWHDRPKRSKASRFSGFDILPCRHSVDTVGRVTCPSSTNTITHLSWPHGLCSGDATHHRPLALSAAITVTLPSSVSRNVHRQTKLKQKNQSLVNNILDIMLVLGTDNTTKCPIKAVSIP